jgi:hypothetical protein
MTIRSFVEDDKAHVGVWRGWPTRWDGPLPLTASVLRQIRLGELVEDVRRLVVKGVGDIPADDPVWGEAVRAWLAPRGRTKRPDPPERYKRAVEVYMRAFQMGSKPTRAVADELHITESAAAKLISRARSKYGLLPPTTQGRAAIRPPAKKKRGTTR